MWCREAHLYKKTLPTFDCEVLGLAEHYQSLEIVGQYVMVLHFDNCLCFEEPKYIPGTVTILSCYVMLYFLPNINQCGEYSIAN